MQNTAFVASRVCSFGKRPCVCGMQNQPLYFMSHIACFTLQPSRAGCTLPRRLPSHMLFFLSGDLAALLIRKWSPLLYLPNLAWPHDCFDQCNSVAPLIGTSHSLPLRSQLSQKDTVALRPPCSEKPQPRGETWKMKCHVGRERDQSAPDVQGRMPRWEWSLQP